MEKLFYSTQSYALQMVEYAGTLLASDIELTAEHLDSYFTRLLFIGNAFQWSLFFYRSKVNNTLR